MADETAGSADGATTAWLIVGTVVTWLVVAGLLWLLRRTARDHKVRARNVHRQLEEYLSGVLVPWEDEAAAPAKLMALIGKLSPSMKTALNDQEASYQKNAAWLKTGRMDGGKP
jgi:hypothetical protein